jgi:hypothetical protein
VTVPVHCALYKASVANSGHFSIVEKGTAVFHVSTDFLSLNTFKFAVSVVPLV